MQKFFFFISLFLCVTVICHGQTTYKLDKDTAKYKNSPLYVLKVPQQVPIPTANLVVNINDIDAINVIKNPESVKLYGHRAEFGVIEVSLKKHAALVNFDQLLTDYDIPYSDSNLPVFIDSVMTTQAKDTYFELTALKSVRIAEEKGTGMRYISILSIYPVRRPKKGDITIKGKATKAKNG